MYVYGKWPSEHIDHINGVTWDDRLCNLRDVSRSLNQANRRLRNKNGAKNGIFKRDGRYAVSISKDNKRFCLGSERAESDAISLYDAAATILFGDNARKRTADIEPRFFDKARKAINRPKRPSKVAVIRCADNKRYSSLADAAEELGVSIQAIRQSVLSGGKSRGHRFVAAL